MFEYEDYLAAPTRENASDFITRALEDNYDRIEKRENYLKSSPPGLVPRGSALMVCSREQMSADFISGGREWPITKAMYGCPSSPCAEDAARLRHDDAGELAGPADRLRYGDVQVHENSVGALSVVRLFFMMSPITPIFTWSVTVPTLQRVSH